MKDKNGRERHTFDCEVRADVERRVIRGHAAIFDTTTSIGGHFDERVDRRAFNNAMASLAENNVMALFNHDPNQVLGSTRAGTLRLSIDDTGLQYEVDVPNTTVGNDLLELVRRGDISKSSFGFSTVEDKWDREKRLRTLIDVKLFDVSPVTYPAYEGTDAGLRSLQEAEKEAEKIFSYRSTRHRVEPWAERAVSPFYPRGDKRIPW